MLKWIKFRGQSLAQQNYGIFSEKFVFFTAKIEKFARAKKFSLLETFYRLLNMDGKFFVKSQFSRIKRA